MFIVARKMYQMRFGEDTTLTMQQLRGRKELRVEKSI